MKKCIVWVLLATLITGCAAQDNMQTAEVARPETQPQQESANITQTLPANVFTDRDYETQYQSNTAQITLTGDTATCGSNAVQIRGSRVTITDEGTYLLSGSLTDGMVVVNAQKEDKVQLVLQNVNIQSATSAPLYILQADKVFVTLEGENRLSNGGSFVAIDDNHIDSVIFSKEDLTLNGSGSLTVSSPAGHGIVSKDELVITGGNYRLTTSGHGMEGNDNVSIADGSFTVAAGKDGIRSENDEDASLGYVYIENGTFDICAEGDGISAGSAMELLGGTYTITTGGGSANGQKHTSDNWGGFGGGRGPGHMGGGMGGFGGVESMETEDDSTSIKGIKACGDLTVRGGTFTIDAADDGVHSNADLTVTGGHFTVATGDDGFHADETLTLIAGTVNITESYEGLEGQHVKIQGGEICLVASDDGLNAAGGTDQSGFGGNRNDMFGGRGPGGMGGGMGGMSAGNGSISISGGMLRVNASGDGIDANGTLEITGGYTVVTGPTQGDTATLDYDTSAVITGGTFIGTGSAGMAQTFSSAEQGVISLNVGIRAAGTQIRLEDQNGNVLIDCVPEMSFAVVILSCPDMVSGESYTITVGTDQEIFAAS